MEPFNILYNVLERRYLIGAHDPSYKGKYHHDCTFLFQLTVNIGGGSGWLSNLASKQFSRIHVYIIRATE